MCADVCVTCGDGGISRNSTACLVFMIALSRRGLLSGLALTGAVCCTSRQRSLFTSVHASVANNLSTSNQGCQQRSQFIENTVGPFFPARDNVTVHHVRSII